MISGITEGNDRASERLRGVREALANRNLDLPDDYVIESPFDLREGASAFNELMNRPTAADGRCCAVRTCSPMAPFSKPRAWGFVFPRTCRSPDSTTPISRRTSRRR